MASYALRRGEMHRRQAVGCVVDDEADRLEIGTDAVGERAMILRQQNLKRFTHRTSNDIGKRPPCDDHCRITRSRVVLEHRTGRLPSA